MTAAGKTVLHVGCGGDPLPVWLAGARETRLDIDGQHHPDILADMRWIPEDAGLFDVVLCQHALEHLYPHDVVPTLAGFARHLKPGGSAVVMVPDLGDVRPTDEVLYESPAGPVAGLDLIYGMRSLIAENPHMAHHSGFTSDTLRAAMEDAGFARVETSRLGYCFNLLGAGVVA